MVGVTFVVGWGDRIGGIKRREAMKGTLILSVVFLIFKKAKEIFVIINTRQLYTGVHFISFKFYQSEIYDKRR